MPRLITNEAYVEEIARRDDLATNDVMAVFAYVFEHLPERVKVYPTENYYYFTFHVRGVPYAGNIRLENVTRDAGKVHFAYSEEAPDEASAGEEFHKLLGAEDGVTVEKVDAFTYRLAFRGKTVMFALNDLSGVTPPPGMIAPGESYIGPVFDESGVRFFLVFNARLKVFHYLLDEAPPAADALKPSRVSDRILIGQRTRFAFYQDSRRNRKILIGAAAVNARANNYYDGPFDQLPDNFIEGEALRQAILRINPKLKGRIDRFGSSFDGQTRFVVGPYLSYENEQDLALFDRCARSRVARRGRYYACFAINERTQGPGRRPRTVAEQPRRRN